MSYLNDSRSESDLTRPGEQWFFYWKTSAALWESRILEFAQSEIIFIPIYWGFHAENATTWDFGDLLAERDLVRLSKLLTQHGRKFSWILPLTPAPFFPNGGVPISSARTLSISPEGSHVVALDQESKLNKMYSYFEPKVFSSFVQFLNSLGQFLTAHHIKAPCWGLKFYYRHENDRCSYLYDRSLAFEQGFSRYLKSNFPQGVELGSAAEEEKFKSNFLSEVQDLFRTAAESSLGSFWSGVQEVLVLGGSPKETLERGLTEGKTQFHYFQDLFDVYIKSQWLSSSLLTPLEKNQLLPKFLTEHFGNAEIEERYHYQINSGDLNQDMRPYSLIDIVTDENCQHFQTNGLLPFLNQHYRWLYHMHPSLNFTTEWIEGHQHQVKFFHGSSMDRTRFGQMLKLFMMGQQIVLDKTGLHPDLEKRLQIFYLENNLKIQSVNFLTSITLCTLGEGRFFAFEGKRLDDHGERAKFWENLFVYLNLTQPEVVADNDVFSLWRIRATSASDLNYIDVRRVNVYNPTSYKKRVLIHTKKHFAFMKMIDPQRAEARTTSQGVEIELLPFGKIALDFGHYEEA